MIRSAGLMLVVASSLPGCAPKPPPATSGEELMFALPNWCGRSGKREKWDEWAVARGREPTGTGVCGVRLDIAGTGNADEGEAGLCVTLDQGAIAKLELKQRGATISPAAVVGMPAKDAYATVRVRIDAPGAESREADVKFRFADSSITAVAPGGTNATGPCFWK